MVVSAPRAVQMHRVRQRRKMSPADIAAVIARQMPDAEKRRRADIVVRTGLSRFARPARLAPPDQGVACMTRAVLFDTETTGLEWVQGHRVIEVAALELVNDLPTGRQFHALIDPERDIPEDATRIHGFTKSTWRASRCSPPSPTSCWSSSATAKLIAHNAPFDFGFLNAELARLQLPPLATGADGRHAGAGKDAVSRHAEQPGRAVPPLRDRPVGPHHRTTPCSTAGCWPRSMSS